MQKITIITFYTLVILLFSSCEKDFEELAENPNNPEEVAPDLLMVNMIRSTANNMVNDAFSIGNVAAQYATEIREPNVDRYIWNSFGLWNDGYSTLRDVNNLYTIAGEREHDNYQGVALIWKTLIFSRLTDAYGDLPFSEALKGKSESVYFPSYDQQQAVYQGMIADLEEANNLLSVTGGSVSSDILYGGDIMKWKKFGNSLRLRLLLRQSNQVDPSAAMQALLADAERYPIFQSNEDQAIVDYTDSPNYFPLAGYRSGHFLDRRLSSTFADHLNTLQDPRVKVFAQPTVASREAAGSGTGELEWQGVPNGETDENLGSDIDRQVSQFGSIYYIDQQVAAPAEGLIMTYAEVAFTLAEAAQRGWINADAEEHYNNGIRASMEYYQGFSEETLLPDELYFQQEGVAFDEAQALELIGLQKWIALFFTDLQGWYEWRRTGLPELAPSIVNNNENRIPVRFNYPTDQQVTNQENYTEAVQRQGRDDINTPVWWDQP
ncbi:MAG: SusD/RagB family nutrient-binding outer membrane lipoprotein [Cyclobacteriaceae bacterium]